MKNLLAHPKTLLAVLAHPDDESFGMGGTLAHYAHQGYRVDLITATRGEAGDVDPEYLKGFESIASRREHELQCAAHHLGITRVHLLDYRDSGMAGSQDNHHPRSLAAAPLEEVASIIAAIIRQVRPQVIVTFDPIGGYKHPDHIKVHQATVAAFELAGSQDFISDKPPYQPQKLYFHSIPKDYLKFGIRVLRLFGRDPARFGRNQDIDLTQLAEESELPIHARIGHPEVQKAVQQAVACHASQGGASMSSGPLAWMRRLFGRQDRFTRAHPPALNGTYEQDLFSGVILDQETG
jgi:LmbE family N-acetylglucosaminyl deacetylase